MGLHLWERLHGQSLREQRQKESGEVPTKLWPTIRLAWGSPRPRGLRATRALC